MQDENRREFPCIFRVALDVMPVQASAVACERVFSSSKETDALRRNRLSTTLMEILQILKFAYRSDRLDFTSHLVLKDGNREAPGSQLDVEPKVIQDLLVSGKIVELMTMITDSYSDTSSTTNGN
jgi:hypothetical protein